MEKVCDDRVYLWSNFWSFSAKSWPIERNKKRSHAQDMSFNTQSNVRYDAINVIALMPESSATSPRTGGIKQSRFVQIWMALPALEVEHRSKSTRASA